MAVCTVEALGLEARHSYRGLSIESESFWAIKVGEIHGLQTSSRTGGPFCRSRCRELRRGAMVRLLPTLFRATRVAFHVVALASVLLMADDAPSPDSPRAPSEADAAPEENETATTLVVPAPRVVQEAEFSRLTDRVDAPSAVLSAGATVRRVDDRTYWVPMGEAKYSFMYSAAGPPAVSRYNLTKTRGIYVNARLVERCPKEASKKHNVADTYRLTSKGEAAKDATRAVFEEWHCTGQSRYGRQDPDCMRACGGFGECDPDCSLARVPGHNCSFRLHFTLTVGDLRRAGGCWRAQLVGEHVPGGRVGVAQEQGEETRRRGFTLAGYSARGRDVVRGGRRVGAAFVPGHDAASGV